MNPINHRVGCDFNGHKIWYRRVWSCTYMVVVNVQKIIMLNTGRISNFIFSVKSSFGNRFLPDTARLGK